MRYYDHLTVIPDFANDPRIGVVVDRADVALGGAPVVSRYPSGPRKTGTFDFTIRGATENRTLRRFIRKHRGSWRPFYMPSWSREFRITEAVASGDRTITVDRDFSAFLTEDRPDTFGRTIYVFSERNKFSVFRVLSQADAATEGEYVLTLDDEFTWDHTTPGTLLAGFAWFARIVGDELAIEYLTPDRATCTIAVIQLLVEQDKAGTFVLTGPEIYESNALVSIAETAADPVNSYHRSNPTIGPETYSEPQSLNFTKAWTGELTDGDYVLTPEGSAGPSTSELFDGDNSIRHISCAFDVGGNEVLAWRKDANTVRLRRYESSVKTTTEFEGQTPVLFQNWTINGSLAGGDADIFCYYLKDNESKLYARVQRDNYATEYVAAVLPIMPLALTGADIDEDNSRLRIHGISTAHNRLEIFSDAYVLPVPPQRAYASGAASMSGTYVYTIVPETVAETDSEVEGAASMSGEYYYDGPVYIDAEATEETVVEGTASVSGEYVDRQVDADGIDETSVEGAAEATGEYTLIAKFVTVEDTMDGSASMSGEYSEP